MENLNLRNSGKVGSGSPLGNGDYGATKIHCHILINKLVA